MSIFNQKIYLNPYIKPTWWFPQFLSLIFYHHLVINVYFVWLRTFYKVITSGTIYKIKISNRFINLPVFIHYTRTIKQISEHGIRQKHYRQKKTGCNYRLIWPMCNHINLSVCGQTITAIISMIVRLIICHYRAYLATIDIESGTGWSSKCSECGRWL